MPDTDVGPGTTEGTADAVETQTSSDEAIDRQTDEDKGPVPYYRFDKMNQERKAAIRRADQLEGDIGTMREEMKGIREALLERGTEATASADSKAGNGEAPAHLSAQDKIAWYVNNAVKTETGMNLAEMKTVLSAIPTLSDQVARSSWTQMTKPSGLDPADTKVRAMVAGLVKEGGMGLEEAIKFVGETLGKKAAGTGKSPPTSAEIAGIAETMVVDGLESWDKETAGKLAAQGKRVAHTDATDLMSKASERRGRQKR